MRSEGKGGRQGGWRRLGARLPWLAVGATLIAAGAGWATSRGRPASAATPADATAIHVETVATTAPDQQVALGKQVYEGKVGGAICTTCHGRNAKGMAGLGPDLTDRTWLHGDGSLGFLKTIIRTGVAKPKQSSAPMPPYGGTPLKAEHLDAVAAYVHSLSQ